MFSQPRTATSTSPRPRRRVAVGAFASAAAAIALVAVPAQAATTSAQADGPAFTITAMKASSTAPARVLTATSDGVVALSRPVPGAADQAWAVAETGGPAAASFAACRETARCAFNLRGEATPRLLVNRATGACLALGAAEAATAPCSASEPAQRIHLNWSDAEAAEAGVPRRYTPLGVEDGGRLRCLTTPKAQAAPLKAAACTNRLRWEQQYRFTAIG